VIRQIEEYGLGIWEWGTMLQKNKKSYNVLAFLHMSVLVFLFLSPPYFFLSFIEANDLLVVYRY
jgi:hypothetical protein